MFRLNIEQFGLGCVSIGTVGTLMEQLKFEQSLLHFHFFLACLHPPSHPFNSYIVSYMIIMCILLYVGTSYWQRLGLNFSVQLLSCSLFSVPYIHHVHLVKKSFLYCLCQCHLHFHFCLSSRLIGRFVSLLFSKKKFLVFSSFFSFIVYFRLKLTIAMGYRPEWVVFLLFYASFLNGICH